MSNPTQIELSFNGIDGATGRYLMSPLTPRQLAGLVSSDLTTKELAELRARITAGRPDYGPKFGIEAEDLSQAGWGVIFGPDITDEVKHELLPLLSLRKEQAGRFYHDFPRERAFRPGDKKNDFLSHSKMGPGPADPERVPYYLLIVGGPEEIPYRFQYQLDLQYAVGRIHFDNPEDYGSYAAAVVKAEKRETCRPRKISLVAVRNDADRATELSSRNLVAPLRESLRLTNSTWDWSNCINGESATKNNILNVLGGAQTPALLFTASHGIAFPTGHHRQFTDQGALLCADWPGPTIHRGPIAEEFYIAGRDIGDDSAVDGLIAFFFACYAGGTPRFDESLHLLNADQSPIASNAFVANLPKRLLSHPRGGALAIIGHVERAWTYSFMWENAGIQLAAFESTLGAMFQGWRIGHAMEYFNQRYAELSSDLVNELQDIEYRIPRSDSETIAEDLTLGGIWTASNDARSYVVLGDPAVRLAI